MYLWSAFDGAVMETNVAFEESLYQQVACPACPAAKLRLPWPQHGGLHSTKAKQSIALVPVPVPLRYR